MFQYTFREKRIFSWPDSCFPFFSFSDLNYGAHSRFPLIPRTHGPFARGRRIKLIYRGNNDKCSKTTLFLSLDPCQKRQRNYPRTAVRIAASFQTVCHHTVVNSSSHENVTRNWHHYHKFIVIGVARPRRKRNRP